MLVGLDESDAISKLAKLTIHVKLAEGKRFMLPAKAQGAGGAFALCCTGCLGAEGTEEPSHRVGDFWHASSTHSELIAKTAASVLFIPVTAIEAMLGTTRGGAEIALLQAIVKLDISTILENVPYMKLAHLDRDTLDALKALFLFEAVPKGKPVYTTGEPADRLYILIHGKIDVMDKDDKVIRTIHAPNFFGATAMLNAKAKRTFTAVASGSAIALLSLSRDRLAHFKELHKESGAQIETMMAQEARGRMVSTALLKGGLLRDSENASKLTNPDKQVARYIALGSCVDSHPAVAEGDCLVEPGATSSAVFFVYQGQLYAGDYQPAAKDDKGSTPPPTWRQRYKEKFKDSPRGSAPAPGPADAPAVKPLAPYKVGTYVGELGLLCQRGEAVPLVAGPGLVVLAADGIGFKKLAELVPTLHAHVALRCVEPANGPDVAYTDSIYNYPPAMKALQAFMKTEYSDEAHDFEADAAAWTTKVRDFVEKAGDSSDALIREELLAIEAKYITPDAEREINLSSDVRNRLVARIKSDPLSVTVFDEARKEMKNLVSRDTLPRFRKTDEFSAILKGEEMGARPAHEPFVFSSVEAFTEAISMAEARAISFPTYAHSTMAISRESWVQYEVDM